MQPSKARALLIAIVLSNSGDLLAAPATDDGLSCHGHMVLIGDGKYDVLRKCGEPVSVGPYCGLGRRRVCWESWLYSPESGSFPRRVVFNNEQVAAIIAESRP